MISIIIPTYNESTAIEKTLRRLTEITSPEMHEIIVADGGSTDDTVSRAKKYALVITGAKGKGKQLNEGARHANGQILFFVHADMQVPDGALEAIAAAVQDGFDGGGSANVFDEHNQKIKRIGRIMNLRFRNKEQSDRCIFYGDNGIFVKQEVFRKLRGFREIAIMEDYDFSIRMKQQFKVRQINEPKLIVSARRHVEAGFIKTRFLWITIRILYKWGVSPDKLADWYADVRG